MKTEIKIVCPTCRTEFVGLWGIPIKHIFNSVKDIYFLPEDWTDILRDGNKPDLAKELEPKPKPKPDPDPPPIKTVDDLKCAIFGRAAFLNNPEPDPPQYVKASLLFAARIKALEERVRYLEKSHGIKP